MKYSCDVKCHIVLEKKCNYDNLVLLWVFCFKKAGKDELLNMMRERGLGWPLMLAILKLDLWNCSEKNIYMSLI